MITRSLKFWFVVTALCVSSLQSATPRVSSLVWGTCTVREGNQLLTFKDCKLSPSGSSDWDWKKTGTLHSPGIQFEDLSDFIDQVDIVILSQGMDGVLQVKPETLLFLKAQQKEYHVLLSPDAVNLYNEMVNRGKRVGALIHSTC